MRLNAIIFTRGASFIVILVFCFAQLNLDWRGTSGTSLKKITDSSNWLKFLLPLAVCDSVSNFNHEWKFGKSNIYHEIVGKDRTSLVFGSNVINIEEDQ